MSTSERESSGEITEKDGFSVVADTSTTQPFSTPGSRTSCWALVNRWISSRKSTVVRPCRSRWSRASSIALRTSRTPAVIADISTKRPPTPRETTCASVVLPVPGGPHSSTDVSPARLPVPPPATIRRSGDPDASRWSWPTTSSRLRGRIRTASGAAGRPDEGS